MIGRAEEEPSPQERLVGATTDPVGGPPEGLILLVFAILTLAASAFVLLREESAAVDDPAEKAARGEIGGLSELSLMRAANLRRALAKVDAGERPLVSTIRVAPERADFTVEGADGSQKTLSVDPGLDVEERDFGTSSGTGAVRASKIDASAPERMLRAVARRTEQPPEAVDYATMSLSGSPPYSWFLGLERGPPRERQWLAAADGSDLHRSGEVAPSQKARDERHRRQLEARQKRIQELFERRSACLRRATSAEQVTRCIERYAP